MKKLSDFEMIKILLDKSPEGEECDVKLSKEDVAILKEGTGVDFTETLAKIGALKD